MCKMVSVVDFSSKEIYSLGTWECMLLFASESCSLVENNFLRDQFNIPLVQRFQIELCLDPSWQHPLTDKQ